MFELGRRRAHRWRAGLNGRDCKAIGRLIQESRGFHGVTSREDARALVQRVREHGELGEDDALAVALHGGEFDAAKD